MAPLIYPGAIFRPLTETHWAPGTIAQRNLSVVHDTEGSTAAGAIATFQSSPPGPLCTSVHFVIDRNAQATVYQLVDLNNTAYHASQANYHAVGTEFAGLTQAGADWYNNHYAAQIIAGTVKRFVFLPGTDAQYEAGALLQSWICRTLGLPVDRNHIRTHNEASPRDGHTYCFSGIMDLDKLVAMAKVA